MTARTSCAHCGAEVSRAGANIVNGGVWMLRHDPIGAFCTVWCAASWAIARAPVIERVEPAEKVRK